MSPSCPVPGQGMTFPLLSQHVVWPVAGKACCTHPSIGTRTVDPPSLTDPMQSAGMFVELKTKNPPEEAYVTPAPSHRMRAPALAAWLPETRTTPSTCVALVTVSAEAGALSTSSAATIPPTSSTHQTFSVSIILSFTFPSLALV